MEENPPATNTAQPEKKSSRLAILCILIAGSLWGCLGLFNRNLSALGIAAKAVERMVDCYGCDRLDILAAVGPGISKCCFETHEDVPNAMTEAMGAAALSSIEVLPTGKFHVDLKGLNAKRLENAGLDPEHIAVSADCTCCLPEKYWSHRYTHGERGSQAAMIAIV